MDKHTFKGKRLLCSTDLSDFTNFQGIGKDPLYKRYDSVESLVDRVIPAEFKNFLAQPDYHPELDQILWYIPDWKDTPEILSSLTGEKYKKYQAVKEKTIKEYKESLGRLSGEDLKVMACAVKYFDDNFIFCSEDKVFAVAWGMSVDPSKYEALGTLIHGAPKITRIPVIYDAGDNGTINGSHQVKINYKEGQTVTDKEVPQVTANDGFEFEGWDPDPVGIKIDSSMKFNARYKETGAVPPPFTPVPPVPPPLPEPSEFLCTFSSGDKGLINGQQKIYKLAGTYLQPEEIPQVISNKGFIFNGWSPNPMTTPIDQDINFTAIYAEKLPWYKKWDWLKWLLLALLAAIIFFVLFGLLRGCKSCHREVVVNGVVPVSDIEVVEGDTISYVGKVKPIELHDGKLPDGGYIAAPIRNADGTMPEIISETGIPSYIPNRLILFLEDDNANLDAFATEFKRVFPGQDYQIIGYDRDVKYLVIQIPESQRDAIRNSLNDRIPDFNFIVFDEEIYQQNGTPGPGFSATPGWHLEAVKAPQAWEITKGDPSVTVAVVDDGIDPSHQLFAGRIVNAYNVFTQNNHLTIGDGHGTHTAALAVGSLDMRNQGAAGIAPECKLMPVQVFDNRMAPLSAVVSGIMYSIHKNADVVNISVGPEFEGLNHLPFEMQVEIANTRFKNIEKLWNRICNIASKKNCILVFAAGNNDIISAIPPENRAGNAIAVGAVDSRLYPTTFTNYGPCTDISAPGEAIMSAFPNNQLRSEDGTSMAAPIVSGAVALMKSLKKDLTVEQAVNILFKTGCDVYGYMPPMVQVNLALEAVKRGDFSAPSPRELYPVPDAAIRNPEYYNGHPPTSWTEPLPEEMVIIPGRPVQSVPVDSRLNGGVIVNEGPVVGTRPVDSGTTPTITPTPGTKLPVNTVDDSEEIRRLIEQYKRKIAELEKQLPENKK